jgi:nucleotide-binding universal stress UspA family protein
VTTTPSAIASRTSLGRSNSPIISRHDIAFRYALDDGQPVIEGADAPVAMGRSALGAPSSRRHARIVNEMRTGGKSVRRLLLAIDRSAASRAALLAVAGLAVGGQTEVVVLHVDDENRPERSRALASDIAWRLIALAVNARPESRPAARGRVAEAIAEAADELGADIVVLGSRGRSDLGGLLLGSVGQEVLRRVACPVLLVRASRHASGRRRRILIAVAGDEDGDALIRMTAAVAERDAQVLVLHVLAPGDGDPELAASHQMVERLVLGMRRCGVRARGRLRRGANGTAGDIARTAQGYGADLVIMGSRRLPALAALLHRSVSLGVVHHSDRPVLVAAAGDARPGPPG